MRQQNGSPRSTHRSRVLLFIPTLAGGGAERVAVNLIRATPSLDWHVAVWRGGGVFEEDLPAGVFRHVLGGKRLRHVAPRFGRLVMDVRPNVLLTSQWEAGVLASLVVPMRLPWIAWEHSCDVPSRPRVLMRYTSLAYNRRAFRVVCVSDQLRKQLIDVGIKPHKVECIYNPLTGPWFEREYPPPLHPWFAKHEVLVSVGNLFPDKGYDILLQAMATLLPRRSSTRLLVLGEGPLRAELTDLSVRLGLTGFVDFVGYQRNPFPYMAASAALVMASRVEGLPTVIIEALACGAPVISTDCPSGPREILQDGTSGLLVPPDDPTALAGAILQVLGDAELRSRFIEEGKKRAKDFSVDRA